MSKYPTRNSSMNYHSEIIKINTDEHGRDSVREKFYDIIALNEIVCKSFDYRKDHLDAFFFADK